MPGQYSVTQIDEPKGKYSLAEALPVTEAATAPSFQGTPARNLRQSKVKQSTPAAVEQQRRDTVPDTSNPLVPANYIYNGTMQVGKGVHEFRGGDYSQGISDMMRGVGTTEAPFTLPLAAISAPLATMLGLTGSSIGGGITGAAARGLGAPEGVSNLAEDAGSIIGGTAGAMGATKVKALAGSAVDNIGTLMQKGYDFATHPVVRNAAGVASPKVGKAIDLVETVKNVYDAVKDARSQPSPASAPQPTPQEAAPAAPKSFDDLLGELRSIIEQKSGKEPGSLAKEFNSKKFPERFAGSDSPVIDSSLRKPGSTAEIANPGTITRAANKTILKELPANSVLLKNPAALQAAADLADALSGKKTKIGNMMKGTK